MNTLLQKIKTVPHLPLLFKFDADLIRDEIQRLPYPLMQYNANKQKDHGHIVDGWNNLALFSLDGSIFCNSDEASGGLEFNKSFGKFSKTGLGEYMPYTYEIVEKLGGGKSMARIEEVHPNTIIGWHSHVLEFQQPDSIIIVQLPITIPKGFKYSVINYRDYRTLDFSKNLLSQYDCRYTEGIPYIFNSYHYHNVFNNGEIAALMIRFFVSLKDLSGLIKPSLDRYSGDLIEG